MLFIYLHISSIDNSLLNVPIFISLYVICLCHLVYSATFMLAFHFIVCSIFNVLKSYLELFLPNLQDRRDDSKRTSAGKGEKSTAHGYKSSG